MEKSGTATSAFAALSYSDAPNGGESAEILKLLPVFWQVCGIVDGKLHFSNNALDFVVGY
jgi:uncharacterized membrane protein